MLGEKDLTKYIKFGWLNKLNLSVGSAKMSLEERAFELERGGGSGVYRWVVEVGWLAT